MAAGASSPDLHLFGDAPHRVDDLAAAAVVDRQAQPRAACWPRSARSSCPSRQRAPSGMPSRRPITLTTMFCRMIVERSSIMYCSSRCIRKSSSCCGRFQFSLDRQIQRELLEMQPGRIPRPFAGRWPRRGDALRSAANACRCAQRPLPSMMTAICRGRRSGGTAAKRSISVCTTADMRVFYFSGCRKRTGRAL